MTSLIGSDLIFVMKSALLHRGKDRAQAKVNDVFKNRALLAQVKQLKRRAAEVDRALDKLREIVQIFRPQRAVLRAESVLQGVILIVPKIFGKIVQRIGKVNKPPELIQKQLLRPVLRRISRVSAAGLHQHSKRVADAVKIRAALGLERGKSAKLLLAQTVKVRQELRRLAMCPAINQPQQPAACALEEAAVTGVVGQLMPAEDYRSRPDLGIPFFIRRAVRRRITADTKRSYHS